MKYILFFLIASPVAANENLAVIAAAKDINKIPSHNRQYIRYIYLRHDSDLQLASLTLNYISRGTVIYRPTPIAKNLLRVDTRLYNADDAWRAAWYELSFDPTFSLLLTKDTLAFAASIGAKQTKTAGVDVVKILAPHIDVNAFTILVNETQSAAPIVEARYFIYRALSTIKDDGVYRTIYGGLYYDFVGIKTGAKKGTDEDVFFEQLGIGNVEHGVTAEKIFDKLRSDSRIAVFRSGVTGRPRRADFLRSLAGRIEDNASLVSVTHDIRSKDIDIGTHPVMNLLAFKDAAREVIYERANGLHGFVLFDGNGKRQDEVPPDIAPDHTVPSPHPTRLQPAIGCIRCHASDSGWRVVHNDAKKLLTGLLDVFPNRRADDVDRLAGLYGGDVERKLLPRARDDYNAAILKATGPLSSGKKDQTEIARIAAVGLSDIYKAYWYDVVTPEDVLADLGYRGSPLNKGLKSLRSIIPPPPIIIDGSIPEDPRIGALLSGIPINRSDYDLIYAFLASRAAPPSLIPPPVGKGMW